MRRSNNISVIKEVIGSVNGLTFFTGRDIVRACCLVGIILFLPGCNATKFLKENETFFKGAEIRLQPQGDIPGQARVKTTLETFITPKPNPKFLGMRTSVWFYY